MTILGISKDMNQNLELIKMEILLQGSDDTDSVWTVKDDVIFKTFTEILAERFPESGGMTGKIKIWSILDAQTDTGTFKKK